MSTGESRRPSLTSGLADRPAVLAATRPASAHILADMEQRKPARPRIGRQFSPLLLACLFGSVLMIGGYLYFAGRPTSSTVGAPLAHSRVTGDATSMPSATMSNASGAAIIIDDRSSDQISIDGRTSADAIDHASLPAQTVATVRAGSRTAGSDATASAVTRAAALDTETSSNHALHTPAATTPMFAARSASASQSSAQAGEPVLFASLLANIHAAPTAQPSVQPLAQTSSPSAPAPRRQDQSAIDVLVAQIQGSGSGPGSSITNAQGSSNGEAPSASAPVLGSGLVLSQVTQQELDQCPAGNTMSGIACRARVCVKYAGSDAACPR